MIAAVRVVLAVAVVAIVVAIAGVGMGSAPKGDPAPTGAALTASRQRVSQGGATVQQGKRIFADQGCDRCHAMAVIGADGKIGPRLDTDSDPVKDTIHNIVAPRSDIADGYPPKLMPTDYAKRMSQAELRDVAAFIKAASGKGKD